MHDARWSPMWTPSRSWCAPILAVSLAACAGHSTESASVDEIVGGSATAAFPAVGALLDGTRPFCTGTLVGPKTVLTAAHCLQGMRTGTLRFAIGPDAFSPRVTLRVLRAVAHPAYDSSRMTSDIGVLVLAANAPVAPIELNHDDLDASWLERDLTFLGYGYTDGVNRSGFGKKRKVKMHIRNVGETTFESGSQDGNTCAGDSGGPALALFASGPRVVGVTSYGDASCTSEGIDTRVDAFASFIERFL